MRRLSDLRRDAKLTQEQFVVSFGLMAEELDVAASVTVRQLRRWEGPNPPLPQPTQQVVLEAMLGVPLEEMGFDVPPQRRTTGEEVQRRQFVIDVAAVAGAAVLPRPGGRRVGASDVERLRETAVGLYRIDHTQGGAAARAHAVRLLGRIDRNLTQGSYLERVGRELHALVGTVHSHLAWLDHDGGQPAAARAACTEALASARLVGDRLLEIRALDALSLLAVEQGRPWEAVAASRASGDLARTAGARVRTIVSLRQARALGTAGDHAAARRALTQALRWQERSDTDTDAPAWTAYSGQREVDYATAAWYVDAGHPGHAVPFLRSVLAQLSDGYSRNRALYRARLAEVLLAAGEVEEACAEAISSAEAAQGMTSARLAERLRTVATVAEQVDTAAARDCVERLRGLGVTAGRRA
ncbi:tetratricopeptide (TPR) repeat protein [Streptacidiphilus sp. BW17]|uniref:hypothetical protein n=1 Tax=Streptacidiphilus sp. BW17 TaxID=3156274 RepID=UPI003515AA82